MGAFAGLCVFPAARSQELHRLRTTPTEHVRKLMVYTRTTNDLATLSHNEETKYMLLPDGEHVDLRILTVASMSSGSVLESELLAACSRKTEEQPRRLLVVVCDMAPKAVTKEQFEVRPRGCVNFHWALTT